MVKLTNTIKALLKQPFVNMTSDSRQVVEGSLFIAYPGEHSDGRAYIGQAIAQGAKAVLWEAGESGCASFTWLPEWTVEQIAVADLKVQVSKIAAEYYGQPTQDKTVIGVTGTNGKTTVTQWIAQCLDALGEKPVVIGTIGNGFVGDMQATVNTTPDAILLQHLLSEYKNQGAKAVAMEVSSHGLTQGRVSGVQFDVAVLTNLSRDHLDYHKTMEAYADAKRQLFQWNGLQCAVVNTDDAFGKTIAGELIESGQTVLSYGLATGLSDQHVQGQDLTFTENGLTMQVTTPKGRAALTAKVLGEFNAYNVLAVLATLLSLDVALDKAIEVIGNIKPVAGRMQQLGGEELPLVVVDFAHTPDALEKVLISLKQQLQNSTNGKLVCVFGCGGDRDAGKRALMGQVAVQYADAVLVTSDNPRGESPQAIVDEITKELSTVFSVELDRAVAITQAVTNAKKGDVVLIAGKGHESYQEVAGIKHVFSDVAVAQQALDDYQVAA